MNSYNFLTLLVVTAFITAGSCQRKFVHSEEELALTTKISDVINSGQCNNNDIAFIVHSAAQSSGRYYKKRQAARQTWAVDARASNISVIFAIALPRDAQTQTELQAEHERYKDMVQFDGFIDDYWNLTLKAVAVNNWITKYCNVQFIAKLDDDIFVNVGKLVESKYEIENGITGHVYGYQTQPIRDPESRYYMPEYAYPDEWYPGYVSGLFYVMTKDIILPLYTSASNWSSSVLDFDDLYMTGIIRERARIQHHRSGQMVFRENTDPDCGVMNIRDLNKLIAYHGCDTAEYSINLYKAWKEAANEDRVSNGSFPVYSGKFLVFVLNGEAWVRSYGPIKLHCWKSSFIQVSGESGRELIPFTFFERCSYPAQRI